MLGTTLSPFRGFSHEEYRFQSLIHNKQLLFFITPWFFFFFFSFQSTTGSKIFFLSFMSRVEAAQNLLKEPRVSPGVCF